MKKKHIIYMDLMRVICIFLMVLVHVVATVNHDVPEQSLYWSILTSVQVAFHFPVPIFLMISGALFLNPERNINIKKLYTRNIVRMLSALIFWAFAYAGYRFVKEYYFDGFSIHEVMKNIYNGEFVFGHYHLWYLYVIIGLYMFVPVIRKITENKKTMEYFLLMAFIFCFVKNMLPIVPKIGYKVEMIVDKMQLEFVMGYTAYFVLGYYLHKFELTKKQKTRLYIAGLGCLVVSEILTIGVFAKNPARNEFFYNQLIATEFIISAAAFVWAKDFLSKFDENSKMVQMMLKIAPLTFGMYLVHDFFIIACNSFGFTAISFFPVIAAPVVTIAVFMCSLIATYLISKIPILNRYVM